MGGLETSGPYSYTFSTALADGNYQAEATATDNDGDVGTSSPVSFQIDTKPPTTSKCERDPEPNQHAPHDQRHGQ